VKTLMIALVAVAANAQVENGARRATRARSLTEQPQTATSPKRTNGHLNGRGWLSVDTDNKLTFLAAYQEGLETGALLCESKIDTAGMFPVRLLTREEIGAGLDRFYADVSNRSIPIPIALQILILKTQGGDKALIEDETAARRLSRSNDDRR
jgi:hypothetical protein